MPSKLRHKEFHFPVHVAWAGGRRTTARVDGKPPVRIATPPEFCGSDPHMWSPEDAFVAAVSSCLAVTIAAFAEHEQLPLRALSIQAEGVVGRRADGRFGFVRIEQTVELETDRQHGRAAQSLVAEAENRCLVSASVDLPVLTKVVIRTPVLAPD